MKKILVFLESWKAVPGPQKIRCSQLEQNCTFLCNRKKEIIFHVLLHENGFNRWLIFLLLPFSIAIWLFKNASININCGDLFLVFLWGVFYLVFEVFREISHQKFPQFNQEPLSKATHKFVIFKKPVIFTLLSTVIQTIKQWHILFAVLNVFLFNSSEWCISFVRGKGGVEIVLEHVFYCFEVLSVL